MRNLEDEIGNWSVYVKLRAITNVELTGYNNW